MGYGISWVMLSWVSVLTTPPAGRLVPTIKPARGCSQHASSCRSQTSEPVLMCLHA